MSGISRQNGSNIGGLAAIHYALMADVKDLFDFDFERDSLSITQAQFDTYFARIYFITRTANHDEVEKPSEQGNYYDQSVQAQFKRDATDLKAQVDHVRNRKLCLIFRDNNGDTKVLPNMMQTTDKRTGKEPKDMNSRTLTFSGKSSYRAPDLAII